jgi:hypothetical protein
MKQTFDLFNKAVKRKGRKKNPSAEKKNNIRAANYFEPPGSDFECTIPGHIYCFSASEEPHKRERTIAIDYLFRN